MSTTTTNYGLTKPDYADFADISIVNNSLDTIDATMKSISDASKFVTASGTNTNITLTLPTLTNGYSTTFIASYNNGGSATTINGKNLYKPNTTTAPTIIKGKAYTIWYDLANNCFFTKASAEGNTIPSHVLAGDTFSNDTDTGQVGTLDLSNLTPSNIKSGVTINGITGSSNVVDTSDGSAIASQILNQKSAYVNGTKVIGTMPNRPNQQTPLSYWNDGNGTLRPRIPTGAYITEQTSGIAEINCYDSNFKASNIVSGKNIFGLNGTASIESLGGKKYVTGTYTTPSISTNDTFTFHSYSHSSYTTPDLNVFELTGFGFKPSVIMLQNKYISIYSGVYDCYRTVMCFNGIWNTNCFTGTPQSGNDIYYAIQSDNSGKIIYDYGHLRIPIPYIGSGKTWDYIIIE